MLQNCIAIILAGGKSQRMGQPKGLLLYKGHYWILEHLKRLKSAGITKILIGLGFDAELYYKAIPELYDALKKCINYDGMQLKVTANTYPQLGAFSTLKNVLKGEDKINDALICPIDVPVLKTSELKKLLDIKAKIVKPIYKNQSGHPIKINAHFVADLLNYPATSRLDTIILKEPKENIFKMNCIDNQVVMNLNTPLDWKKYTDDLPLTQKTITYEN